MALSVYIHIPFCQVRCAYCDFNTYAGLEKLMPAYVRALCREIVLVGEASAALPEVAARGPGARLQVHTVFFGGGTPSLLSPPLLAAVFLALRQAFEITPDSEVTLEANPGTVDAAKLAAYRGLGVNRLSFGVQSAQPDELRLLDRLHTFEQAVEAVRLARAAGFENLNLDLIYGIMGQTLAAWQETLGRALDLAPEHLSLYALTLEHGTPMAARVEQGLLPEPDPDLAADMYEWAEEALLAGGFAHYEISNWARRSAEDGPWMPRLACRHNLQTWRNLPYLGFGAGAHGCAAGWRYSNVLSPQAYLARQAGEAATGFPFSAAVEERRAVDPTTQMNETVMLGMRLVAEGVPEADFRTRFGVDLRAAYAGDWAELEKLGLVEWGHGRVRLTPRGRLLGNHVFARFV